VLDTLASLTLPFVKTHVARCTAPSGGHPRFSWTPSSPIVLPCVRASGGPLRAGMYLRSILLSTGTSLFCRQFQGALGGREDRLAPIILLSCCCEVLLRSTFQRSRGIIVKRLSPFSLERSVPPASVHLARASLNTLVALATDSLFHSFNAARSALY